MTAADLTGPAEEGLRIANPLTLLASIDEATAADLPCVLRLYAENETTPDDVLQLSDARAIWEQFSAYPNYKLYVARIAGEIVGTFALLIVDNLAHRGAKSGVVEDVIVGAKFPSYNRRLEIQLRTNTHTKKMGWAALTGKTEIRNGHMADSRKNRCNLHCSCGQ
jgi:hypothetical protein